MAVRVNYGDLDYGVAMTMEQLTATIESAASLSGNGFVTLPLTLGGDPYRTIRLRPSCIRFYYEELD